MTTRSRRGPAKWRRQAPAAARGGEPEEGAAGGRAALLLGGLGRAALGQLRLGRGALGRGGLARLLDDRRSGARPGSTAAATTAAFPEHDAARLRVRWRRRASGAGAGAHCRGTGFGVSADIGCCATNFLFWYLSLIQSAIFAGFDLESGTSKEGGTLASQIALARALPT